jgi:hypothetical protein
MKKMSKLSNQTLNKLWEMAKRNKDNEGYVKLNNDPSYIPLNVEIISKNEISLCHYKELNGDLMRDPEMVFFKNDGEWFPTYFRNDYLGVEDFSIRHSDSKIIAVDERLVYSQSEFANIWLFNIKLQQLMKG